MAVSFWGVVETVREDEHIADSADGEEDAVRVDSLVSSQCWVPDSVGEFAVNEAGAEGCLQACRLLAEEDVSAQETYRGYLAPRSS